MPDPSDRADHAPRRARRPRSDHATILSLVVAVLALGWTIYAYYYPQTAPTAVPPPIPTSSVAPGPSATVGSSAPKASPSRQIGDWVSSAGGWADDAWARLSDRYENDRHDRSRWSLLFTWCLMTGLMLWLIADGLRVVAMPLMQLAYLYYYSPSLSGWGIAVSIVGSVLGTIAAVVVRLEQG